MILKLFYVVLAIALPLDLAFAASFFESPISAVRLEAEFQKLFSDDCESNLKAKPFVPGRLSMLVDGRQFTVPTQVFVRGKTSRKDCEFKKLSLEFNAADVLGTPLENIKKLSLNTHCAEQYRYPYTDMGRIRGSQGPIRESVVYQWQEALGLPAQQSKLLPIEYVYDGQVERHSVLFLETKKNLAKRVGSKLVKEKILESAEDQTLLDDISRDAKNQSTLSALLFNALILNKDFGLQITDNNGDRHYNPISPPPGFWNLLLLKSEGQGYKILPLDYDMSRAVTQAPFETNEVARIVSGCVSDICQAQFLYIQKWRAFFPKTVLDSVLGQFVSKAPQLKDIAKRDPWLSPEEISYFHDLVDGFVEIALNRTNVPVLLKTTAIFQDEDLKKPWNNVTAVAGMPIKIVRETNTAAQVYVLDTRDGALLDPESLDSREGLVWVPRSAIR